MALAKDKRNLPHLVWRAVLDTEVLRVQSADEGMERLELTATKAEDVRLIYDWIRDFPMPVELRQDNSEIVTGTYPLPVVDGGGAVIVPHNEPSAGLKLRKKLSLD